MEIKQRSGLNNQIYFAVNGALATSTNVFTANVYASYYYGNSIDNSGPSSYVERAVVNDKAGRCASHPFVLSNMRSLIGTVSADTSHDEDRFRNTITGAQPVEDNGSPSPHASATFSF